MGGTVGAIVTCPLEVVKTRLQSSCANFDAVAVNRRPRYIATCQVAGAVADAQQEMITFNFATQYSFPIPPIFSAISGAGVVRLQTPGRVGIITCLRTILEQEGKLQTHFNNL